MEPLIKRDEYLKRVNKLVNSFPLYLLLGSVLIVVLYHSIGYMLAGDRESLFGVSMLSESFFQGTVITVVIYFFKSKKLGGVVKTKPTDFTQGEVQGYLPVVVGKKIRGGIQAGYLIIENNQLHLHMKKIDGFVIEKRWDDLSKVKCNIVHESKNIYLLMVFGFRDTIEISDGVNTEQIIFPYAKTSIEEIKASIKSYIK